MCEKLAREEFNVLAAAAEGKTLPGTTDCRVEKLTQFGFIQDGCVTKAGLDALEPFRAKRAIFVAAGFGSRLVPITLNTPKPLVRVNGIRIIDSLIDAVLAAGIEEVIIVRGYLGEQFDQLLYKYPMIRFLDNSAYKVANNISSVMLARNLLSNAYVLEADLLVRNPAIITKYHYRSDVLGIWKDQTDDWCLTEKNGCVDEEKIGGKNCWQMVGIYYWNRSDGARLANHVAQAYRMPGGQNRYWETVPNQVFRGQYQVEIRPCFDEDITEIDTFSELKVLDRAYDVQ